MSLPQLMPTHKDQPGQCASPGGIGAPRQQLLPTRLGCGAGCGTWQQGLILVHVCNVAGGPSAVRRQPQHQVLQP
jgi:hypothetical protein